MNSEAWIKQTQQSTEKSQGTTLVFVLDLGKRGQGNKLRDLDQTNPTINREIKGKQVTQQLADGRNVKKKLVMVQTVLKKREINNQPGTKMVTNHKCEGNNSEI